MHDLMHDLSFLINDRAQEKSGEQPVASRLAARSRP